MPKYDRIADTLLAAGEAEDGQQEEEWEERVSTTVNRTMLFNYLRIHRHSYLCTGSTSTDRDVRSQDQATRVVHAR